MSSETSVLAPNDHRDLANPVSARVQLRDVRLKYLRAKANPQTSQEIHYRVSLSQGASAAWDAATGILSVIANFVFKAEDISENQNAEPILVESAFFLRYDVSEHSGFTKEHFDAFAIANGVFNAWPYWRELLQTTLTRMGLPAFTLPVMRL